MFTASISPVRKFQLYFSLQDLLSSSFRHYTTVHLHFSLHPAPLAGRVLLNSKRVGLSPASTGSVSCLLGLADLHTVLKEEDRKLPDAHML